MHPHQCVHLTIVKRFSIALILPLILLGGTASWAQVGEQPVSVSPDVPIYTDALIRLRVATSTIVPVGTNTFRYSPGGRFQIQTASQVPMGGNPTVRGDENKLIASVFADGGYTSKATIAVDPDELTGDGYYDIHDLQQRVTAIANPANLFNFWPVPLTAGTRDVTGVGLVPIELENNVPTSWVSVRHAFTVLGDTVQLEYIVENTTNQRRNIGLRILVDGLFGGASEQDGSPILLPDGRTILNETVIPDPMRPHDTIPSTWVSYDDPLDPLMAVRGTIDGSEVSNRGLATHAAGRPDSISWGQMRNIGQVNQFYFTPNQQASLVGENWGYAVLWEPRELAPGESRRYVTYYGFGGSASDYDPPYALMGYAPMRLQQQEGDDPSTPDVVESFYLTDSQGRSPFPIAVYMDNFGSTPLLDASVRVRLPLGLELAEGETLTKSAGTINRNEIKSVQWNVRATAARPGRAEVKFTGPRGKVVSRTINIPAVPVLNPLPDNLTGLEMISLPFNFLNSDAEAVFASLGSLLPGGSSTIIRYDPVVNEYRWFPHQSTTSVNPGMGIWLLNRNARQMVFNNAVEVDNTQQFNYSIRKGWNQIGNPFTVSIRFDQVRVIGPYGGDWSMEEAVARDLVMPTLYSYDPSLNQYDWDLELSETIMEPYLGYWIFAKQDITLAYPPPSLLPAQQVATGPASAGTAENGWRVALNVSSPGVNTNTVYFGAREGAGQDLDRYDIAQPPAALRTNAAFLNTALYADGPSIGTPLIVDTRGPINEVKEWFMTVQGNVAERPVTVSWPSLEALPRDLVATLVDESTGERRYMRTTSSYTFSAGVQGVDRVLKIVVQPRPASGLVVSGVSAAQNSQGTVALSYTLSTEAEVDVKIRNIAGRVVRQVQNAKLSSAGLNTTLWNGRNERGLAVPAGRYLCEITARSPLTGQAASVVHPLTVQR